MFILILSFITCFQTILSIGNCECGIGRRPEATPRIINGKIVSPEGVYPWMVWLAGGCGRTLISNQHILTAAHCRNNSKGMKVHFGSNDREKQEEAIVAVVNDNPKYKRVIQNDISILTLTKPIKFTHKVKPICLPTLSSVYNEGFGYGIAAGWGLTESGAKLLNMLRRGNMKIVNDRIDIIYFFLLFISRF